MTPEHVTREALHYVSQLTGDAYREAEVRSMSIFPIAKMFGFLQDWPETYPELSQEQRCALAYFGACIGLREKGMPGGGRHAGEPHEEAARLRNHIGQKVTAILELPSGRRQLAGKLVSVDCNFVTTARVETLLGTYSTTDIGSVVPVKDCERE